MPELDIGYTAEDKLNCGQFFMQFNVSQKKYAKISSLFDFNAK